jgi:hypothetical protein
MHWTGGNYNGKPDAHAYNFVLNGDGSLVNGVPIERNIGRLSTGYAAHTRGANTNNIGISVAAMGGSSEAEAQQGRYGQFPITEEQVTGLITSVAEICHTYGIPVIPTRVLCHSEWTQVKGILQRGKWDINYIPHLDMRDRELEDGTRRVGNFLRASIRDCMAGLPLVLVEEQEHAAGERELFLRYVALYDQAAALGASEQFMSALKQIRQMKPLKGQQR